ncbi:SAM-dependent methyltransferase [Actinocrinis puniceicyclus]|uniref:SAM-dependent methyltransferase n=1 Tax=Actinocrinis puniceicyclus TaxID=977794 RepID=A0A8J8BAR2_9ACTN|nr:SAM-dependent methyltransferase [Actinocrinis puniceicyclus]
MYDYHLGGSHNFAADRALAEQAMAAWPDARTFAVANRAFLRRVVALLAGLGVDPRRWIRWTGTRRVTRCTPPWAAGPDRAGRPRPGRRYPAPPPRGRPSPLSVVTRFLDGVGTSPSKHSSSATGSRLIARSIGGGNCGCRPSWHSASSARSSLRGSRVPGAQVTRLRGRGLTLRQEDCRRQ